MCAQHVLIPNRLPIQLLPLVSISNPKGRDVTHVFFLSVRSIDYKGTCQLGWIPASNSEQGDGAGIQFEICVLARLGK